MATATYTRTRTATGIRLTAMLGTTTTFTHDYPDAQSTATQVALWGKSGMVCTQDDAQGAATPKAVPMASAPRMTAPPSTNGHRGHHYTSVPLGDVVLLTLWQDGDERPVLREKYNAGAATAQVKAWKKAGYRESAAPVVVTPKPAPVVQPPRPVVSAAQSRIDGCTKLLALLTAATEGLNQLGMADHTPAIRGVYVAVRDAAEKARAERDAKPAVKMPANAVAAPSVPTTNVNAQSTVVSPPVPTTTPQAAAIPVARCPATMKNGKPCVNSPTKTGLCSGHQRAADAAARKAAAAVPAKPVPQVTLTVDADKAAILARLSKLDLATLETLAAIAQ